MLLPPLKNDRSWWIAFLVLLPAALFLMVGLVRVGLSLAPGGEEILTETRWAAAGLMIVALVIAGPLAALALTLLPPGSAERPSAPSQPNPQPAARAPEPTLRAASQFADQTERNANEGEDSATSRDAGRAREP